MGLGNYDRGRVRTDCSYEQIRIGIVEETLLVLQDPIERWDQVRITGSDMHGGVYDMQRGGIRSGLQARGRLGLGNVLAVGFV